MKKIIFLFILCLFFMPFSVKAEEIDPSQDQEINVEETNEEEKIEFDIESYVNEIKQEYEEIKETQTYALVIFIGGGIGAIIGAIAFTRKKLNRVDSLTTDVNASTTTALDIVANLGEKVVSLASEVKDLSGAVTPLKDRIENTEKICSIAFLNDPKLVESGQASEIGKVIDNENDN